MLLEILGMFLTVGFSEYEKIVADAKMYDDNIIEIVSVKVIFDMRVFMISDIISVLL